MYGEDDSSNAPSYTIVLFMMGADGKSDVGGSCSSDDDAFWLVLGEGQKVMV